MYGKWFAAEGFNRGNDYFMFVCGYSSFMYAFLCSEFLIAMFLVGNINHPNIAYLQCVLGYEIEREFLSVFTFEITEVMQTACELFRLFLIAPITDNHR